MGTEILVILLLVPLAVGLYDIVRIIQRRNAIKHALLLLLGIAALTYMGWSSVRDGYHPIQGLVVGSFFYLPAYVMLWGAVTGGAFLYRRRLR